MPKPRICFITTSETDRNSPFWVRGPWEFYCLLFSFLFWLFLYLFLPCTCPLSLSLFLSHLLSLSSSLSLFLHSFLPLSLSTSYLCLLSFFSSLITTKDLNLFGTLQENSPHTLYLHICSACRVPIAQGTSLDPSFHNVFTLLVGLLLNLEICLFILTFYCMFCQNLVCLSILDFFFPWAKFGSTIWRLSFPSTGLIFPHYAFKEGSVGKNKMERKSNETR